MIIYNPHNTPLIRERIKQAEEILAQIPVKYAFISGSFLYKENYNDIDVFVLSRSKKSLAHPNKKVKITLLDFNAMYSLFYHSVAKSCVAKELLATMPLKVTLCSYWNVINEAVPELFNNKRTYAKYVRSLILYTEYFLTEQVLDTVELDRRIQGFSDYSEILSYLTENLPRIVGKHIRRAYLKRFFYTKAAHYKGLQEYDSHQFLYNLTHLAVKGTTYGQPLSIQTEHSQSAITRVQS